MKNVFVLLMALTLTGGASADYASGSPWGIVGNDLNPYFFDTDGNLTDLNEGTGEITDLWSTWGLDAWEAGSVVVSSGICTITTESFERAFSNDNALVDMLATEADDLEIVLVVDSITGPGYVSMKLECFDTTDAFPNDNNGTGDIGVADFEAAGQTYTAPGEYYFRCSDIGFTLPAGTVAVTPNIVVAGGVAGSPTVVGIDLIWIGRESWPCGEFTKAFNANPDNSSIQPSGSVTQLEWDLPGPMDCTSDLTVNLRFEQELGTDGSGNYVYDPNWGAANGTPTIMVTNSGINMTSQSVSELAPYPSPLADGLYSWRVDITDPSVGGPGTTEGNVWLFAVSDCYNIDLVGDIDNNCRVDLGDVALLAANWLLDCIDDPTDPACVVP